MSAVTNPSQSDRRGANRPHEGDIHVCPRCGAALRFSDRTLWLRTTGLLEPAWACDNTACGYQAFVRQAKTAD
ncbi:MAG: hypothetical protein JWL71_3398 [Acidobacteria bacterium]|nr:hypothetical protein [Acidobacteriota bacterium]